MPSGHAESFGNQRSQVPDKIQSLAPGKPIKVIAFFVFVTKLENDMIIGIFTAVKKPHWNCTLHRLIISLIIPSIDYFWLFYVLVPCSE